MNFFNALVILFGTIAAFILSAVLGMYMWNTHSIYIDKYERERIKVETFCGNEDCKRLVGDFLQRTAEFNDAK